MKARYLAGCLLLTSALLSACGRSRDDSVLIFQSLSDQPAAIAATRTIVESWNRLHPQLPVKIVRTGWDSSYDKLVTQFNTGAAPDIIHNEVADIAPFAKDDYLADLSAYLPERKRADIPAGIRDAVTVDGQLIGYPTEAQSYLVFANRTLLTRSGIPIPTGPTMSWDQLRRLAAACTGHGGYGLGWGLSSPTSTFLSLAAGFGGNYFRTAGHHTAIEVGRGEMALPELVAAMAHHDHSILPVTLTQPGVQALAPFYAGQVAMTIQGSFQAVNIAKDAPADLDWVVLPPLTGSVGPAQASSPQTLSVNKDSRHVREAAAFVDFFTETEHLAALSEADGLIPATTSARNALTAKLGSHNGWEVILSSGRYLTAAPYLFVDKYPQWKDLIATPAYQLFLAGRIDAAGLARKLRDGWRTVDN